MNLIRIFVAEPKFQPFFIHLADGQILFAAKRESVALGQNVAVLINGEDQIRTLDPRQIASVEEASEVPKK